MNAYLVLMALTCLLLFWYYKIAYLTLFRMVIDYRRLTKKTGTKITGEILDVQQKKRRQNSAAIPTKILVKFPNLTGSLITERFKFLDSRPLRKRFGKGKTIPLLLDKNALGKRKVILDNGQAKINSAIVGIEIALLAILAIGIYWLYSMLWQQAEGDWSRFVAQFNDSTIGMLICIYAAVLLFQYFLFKWLGVAFIDKKSLSYLKYHGQRTTATIDSFEATGTKINRQHQISFNFSFTDKAGKTHQGKDKKLVSPLLLGKLGDQNQLAIIYLEEAPASARIFENVNDAFDNRLPTLIFYFIFFLFSVVILALFLATTLL